jgi:hypothetical protein
MYEKSRGIHYINETYLIICDTDILQRIESFNVSDNVQSEIAIPG